MASALEQIRGLVLSADEVRRMTGWTDDQMVEDYLTIIRNFAELAEIIDSNEGGVLDLIVKIGRQIESLSGGIAKANSMISNNKKTINRNERLLYAW